LLSTVTVGEATVSLGQDYYVTIPSSNADGSNVVMLARVVRITPNPTLTFHVRPYEFVGMQLMHVSLDNGASRVRRGISVELGQREFAVPPAALDLTTALFVLDDEMAQHVYFLAPSTSSARGRTPPGSAAHSVLSGVHKDLALDDHQLQQHIAVELLTTPNSKFPDAGPPHLFLDELSLGAAPTLLDGGGGGGGGGVDPLSPRPAGEAVVAVVNTGDCPLHLKWGPRPILKGGDLFFTQALLALNGAPALEVGKPVMVRLKRSHTSDDLGGASSNLINISSSSCDVVMISGIVASLRRQSESRMVLELQRSTDSVQLLIETEMMLVEQGPPPMIEALSVVPAKVMPRLAL
jgi:hypothetical protein